MDFERDLILGYDRDEEAEGPPRHDDTDDDADDLWDNPDDDEEDLEDIEDDEDEMDDLDYGDDPVDDGVRDFDNYPFAGDE